MKHIIIAGFLSLTSMAQAYTVGIYDSETDHDKATVIFTCDKKLYRLNLYKNQLEVKYSDIESWVMAMKQTCSEGERK